MITIAADSRTYIWWVCLITFFELQPTPATLILPEGYCCRVCNISIDLVPVAQKLPCNHVFCSQCLQRIYKKWQEIRCAKCKWELNKMLLIQGQRNSVKAGFGQHAANFWLPDCLSLVEYIFRYEQFCFHHCRSVYKELKVGDLPKVRRLGVVEDTQVILSYQIFNGRPVWQCLNWDFFHCFSFTYRYPFLSFD